MRDLAELRRGRVGEIVRARGSVRLGELCGELGVSAATVRRDLRVLEGLGELRRVHGGAVSLGGRLEEPVFEVKAGIAAAEKRRIARAALELVEPGDTVFLDGGSTVLELARLLRDRSGITVVTNSVGAIAELAGGGPRLLVLGGELRRLSQAVVGPLTRLMLDELQMDKAFMGTLGLSLEAGMTTTDPGEAYTKIRVMERSRRVVLLVDSGKVGKAGMSRAGGLEDIDVMITDSGMGDEFVRDVAKLGVEVVRA